MKYLNRFGRGFGIFCVVFTVLILIKDIDHKIPWFLYLSIPIMLYVVGYVAEMVFTKHSEPTLDEAEAELRAEIENILNVDSLKNSNKVHALGTLLAKRTALDLAIPRMQSNIDYAKTSRDLINGIIDNIKKKEGT